MSLRVRVVGAQVVRVQTSEAHSQAGREDAGALYLKHYKIEPARPNQPLSRGRLTSESTLRHGSASLRPVPLQGSESLHVTSSGVSLARATRHAGPRSPPQRLMWLAGVRALASPNPQPAVAGARQPEP